MTQTDATTVTAASRPAMASLFVVVFIDLVGFGMILPVLPYYAQAFGASTATVGYLFASYSLMQFICAPLWGRLSDRIGRRPVLLISIAGTAIGFFLYGVAGSLSFLFLARMFSGSMAANIAVAQAYVADVTKPEDRAKGMGMIGAAIGLGFIAGPALGGELGRLGSSAPGFAAAGLSAMNLVLAYFVLREPLRRKTSNSDPRFGGLLHLPKAFGGLGLLGLIVVLFITIFAMSNMEATFSLMVERTVFSGVDYDLLGIYTGRLFAFIGLWMVLVQGVLVGRLVRLVGEGRLLILGLIIEGCALLAMPYAPTVGWLLPVLALLALGTGVTSPSVHSIMSQRSPENIRGTVLGLSQSASSLARVVGPVCGGLLFEYVDLKAPYWMAGAGVAVACVMALKYGRKPRSSMPVMDSEQVPKIAPVEE